MSLALLQLPKYFLLKNLYRSDVLITTLSWALIIAEQFFEDKGNHFIFFIVFPDFYDISVTRNS